MIMNTSKLPIKNLPESERPYEKCQKLGVKALSDAELLAVIIKTGTKNIRSTELALHILNLCAPKGGLSGLCHLTLSDLQKVKGIGKVKAIQVLCAAELSIRISASAAAGKLNFNRPDTIAAYYMEEMRHYTQEHLMLMMFDTKNRLIKDCLMFKGTVNAAMINPREIFIEALKHDAVSIVLVHNHPSGDPAPSTEDIKVTRTMAHAGRLIGIQLLDHLIIGDHRYESLARYLAEN